MTITIPKSEATSPDYTYYEGEGQPDRVQPVAKTRSIMPRKAATYRWAKRRAHWVRWRAVPAINLQGPFEYVPPKVRYRFNYAGRKVRV